MEGIKYNSRPVKGDRRDEGGHGFGNEEEVRKVIENHVNQGTLGGAIGNAPTVPVKDF